MTDLGDRKRRWGIILAGGDGVRLKPLTRLISGDDRPKQFCPLYGGRTLLDQARARAEQTVSPERVLFSLNRDHEGWYRRTLADCPRQRLVQPRNRGTLAAILSSLLVIAHKDRQARVAVFPSDHHYSDESVIIGAVENAFALSGAEPGSVVLVGAKANGPEIDYGWIEVGPSIRSRYDSFQVRQFHEKPSLALARFLVDQNALWNTFVMVGSVLAFLELICAAMPGVLSTFQQFPALRALGGELRIPDALYARIPSANFSRDVLAVEYQRLRVHRLGPVQWSDLGDCERALAALSEAGTEPAWAATWRAAKPPVSVVPVALAARI